MVTDFPQAEFPYSERCSPAPRSTNGTAVFFETDITLRSRSTAGDGAPRSLARSSTRLVRIGNPHSPFCLETPFISSQPNPGNSRNYPRRLEERWHLASRHRRRVDSNVYDYGPGPP